MEARKYQVLPLDASEFTRFVAPRPSLTAGRTEFNYTTPVTGIPLGDAPNLLNTSYTITADIEVPAGGAEGMLMTQGGRFGGWGFYLVKGKPVFTWNLLDLKRVRWEGPEQLAPGKHTLVFDFKYDGLGAGTLAFNNLSGIARGGTGVFKVDGKEVASQKLERTIPFLLQWDETFDIGSDTGTGVDDRDYQVPFAFTGKIVKLNIKIDRPQVVGGRHQASRNERPTEQPQKRVAGRGETAEAARDDWNVRFWHKADISMLKSSIEWILISGLLTAGAGLVAALFPHFQLRSTFEVENPASIAVFFVRHWGTLIFVVGCLIIYSAFAPAIRVPVLIAAAIEKFAVGLLVFFGPIKRTSGMTTIAVGGGVFAILYVVYLVGL